MQINLGQLILKHGRSTALFTTIAVQLTLILLYFGSASIIHSRNQKILLDTATYGLSHGVVEETERMSKRLHLFELWVDRIQHSAESFFEEFNLNTAGPGDADSEFATAENGVYYKVNDDGGAHLYYTATVLQTTETKRKARQSAVLDKILKTTVQHDSLISAAYMNTTDGMNRYYPFIDQVYNVFPAELDIRNYSFFAVADESNNPERKRVWTEPYLDPAGEGWMVSCAAPVYMDDKLEAVCGVDITLDLLAKDGLELNLPWATQCLLMNRNGAVITSSESLDDLLGLSRTLGKPIKALIDTTITPPVDYRLEALSRELSEPVAELLNGNANYLTATIGGIPYLLHGLSLGDTPFVMIALTNKETLLKPIIELQHSVLVAGLVFLFLFVITDFILLLWLTKRSRALATTIASPLTALNKATSRLREHQEASSIDESPIVEIELLRSNFEEMVEGVQQARRGITRLNHSYSRFVPDDFLHHLDKKSIVEVRAGDHVYKPLAILYADLRGIRSVALKLNARQTFAYINSCLEKLGPEIRSRQGFVERYGGDTILALFRESDAALEAALAMTGTLEVLNSDFDSGGLPRIRMGIGLHHGPVMVGAVGESNRIEAAALGSSIRQAISLEELNKVRGTQILLSDKFKDSLKDTANYMFHTLPPMYMYEESESQNIFTVQILPSSS